MVVGGRIVWLRRSVVFIARLDAATAILTETQKKERKSERATVAAEEIEKVFHVPLGPLMQCRV